jgi:YHS domain-containing protein
MSKVHGFIGCAAMLFAAAILAVGCQETGKESTGGTTTTKQLGSESRQPAKAGKPQALCPVEGGKIDKTIFADYQGKRVYFCCAMCPAKFKEDPQKYIKKMEDEGIVLEKAPAGEPPK